MTGLIISSNPFLMRAVRIAIADTFDKMFDYCETCFNSGMIKSIVLVCLDIYEKIKYSDDKMKLHAGSVIIENMKRKLSERSDLGYQVIENRSLEKYYLEVLK